MIEPQYLVGKKGEPNQANDQTRSIFSCNPEKATILSNEDCLVTINGLGNKGGKVCEKMSCLTYDAKNKASILAFDIEIKAEIFEASLQFSESCLTFPYVYMDGLDTHVTKALKIRYG